MAQYAVELFDSLGPRLDDQIPFAIGRMDRLHRRHTGKDAFDPVGARPFDGQEGMAPDRAVTHVFFQDQREAQNRAGTDQTLNPRADRDPRQARGGGQRRIGHPRIAAQFCDDLVVNFVHGVSVCFVG